MRCDECKFFAKPDDQFDETWRGDFGLCSRTPHAEDVGEWDAGMNWAMNAEHKDRTAVVQDASGYHASLYSLPSHFCAMFESAEKVSQK
ncbi:hypothetical protein [Thioclava sp. DLFJ4-1]|uniref:hypothetical protein n=1 Tax=Thioclava sp. DLFJ4-1 TaxID=1915313 RepID=UPI000996FCAA|nr:hypothetical protein [Thioclava sp. DLFJ4-1]OOY15101.1 hypothetical protein BMI85_16270 [Thioclava sp. DLFJ4-1]